MYRRILVPVDGSEAASLGVREAAELAKIHQGQLCLIHVIDRRFFAANVEAFGAGPYTDELMRAVHDNAQTVLEQADAVAKQEGIPSERVLLDSPSQSVSDAVIEQANKWRADLIVMGTHGRHGVRRLVLGSDAEQVLRQSPVPVLLIRG